MTIFFFYVNIGAQGGRELERNFYKDISDPGDYRVSVHIDRRYFAWDTTFIVKLRLLSRLAYRNTDDSERLYDSNLFTNTVGEAGVIWICQDTMRDIFLLQGSFFNAPKIVSLMRDIVC